MGSSIAFPSTDSGTSMPIESVEESISSVEADGRAMASWDARPQLNPVFGVHLEQERQYGPHEGSVAQHHRLRGNGDLVHRDCILASEANGCGPGGLRVELRASRLLRQGGQESRRPATSRKEASSKGVHCSTGSAEHLMEQQQPGAQRRCRNASAF